MSGAAAHHQRGQLLSARRGAGLWRTQTRHRETTQVRAQLLLRTCRDERDVRQRRAVEVRRKTRVFGPPRVRARLQLDHVRVSPVERHAHEPALAARGEVSHDLNGVGRGDAGVAAEDAHLLVLSSELGQLHGHCGNSVPGEPRG